jgi:hypothetical protein
MPYLIVIKEENVKVTHKITALVVVSSFVFIQGCTITVLRPTAIAQNVHIISEQQAKKCHFVGSVSTHNDNLLSKTPKLDARNRALNHVAELGGNSLRIVSENTQIAPSGRGSIHFLSGEAFLCK